MIRRSTIGLTVFTASHALCGGLCIILCIYMHSDEVNSDIICNVVLKQVIRSNEMCLFRFVYQQMLIKAPRQKDTGNTNRIHKHTKYVARTQKHTHMHNKIICRIKSCRSMFELDAVYCIVELLIRGTKQSHVA